MSSFVSTEAMRTSSPSASSIHDAGVRPEAQLGQLLAGGAELADPGRPAERERSPTQRRALGLERDVAEHPQIAADRAPAGDLEIAADLDRRGLQRARDEAHGLSERLA
jgi:hypothetical protein